MNQSLFEYSIRESAKAKHCRLKVSIRNGLEVIIPRGFNKSHIPGILYKKQRWIRNAIERVEQQGRFVLHEADVKLPDHIFLTAIGETRAIQYKEGKTKRVGVYETGNGHLTVRGNVQDNTACKVALRRWLSRKAHEKLEPWLRDLSMDTGLRFNHVLVRCQKTRWGSCSRHKTISLNLKLLFLPVPIVRYVLVHELCHTIHMNHSQKYWGFLASKEANYVTLDKELRDAWRTIPQWVDL